MSLLPGESRSRTGAFVLPPWRRGSNVAVTLAALALAAAGVLAAGAAGGPEARAAAPRCTLRAFTIDTGAAGDHALHDIEALGPGDIWAVGERERTEALAYHFDGRRWRRSKLAPGPAGTTYMALDAVAARAANDVWAFGVMGDARQRSLLVERWNGSRWRLVANAPLRGIRGDLSVDGAVAISENEVWVVGGVGLDSGWVRYSLRWDGRAWTRFDLPGPALDIAGSARAGVWVVGGRYSQSEIYRWDGSQWAVQYTNGSSRTSLVGGDVTRGAGLVAVGAEGADGLVVSGPSPSWQPTVIPKPFWTGLALDDVAVVSGADAWAAGFVTYYRQLNTIEVPRFYRWNGARWSRVVTPLDDRGARFEALTRVPGTRQVYAAGHAEYTFGVPDDGFIVRLC
jgi:hypothetical protein